MNHLRQLGGHHQNPFSGKVTDFNMWGRSFTKEELVSFTTCKTEKLATLKREAKVVDWTNLSVFYQGSNVVEGVASNDDICHNVTSQSDVVLFPTQVTFHSAASICRQVSMLQNVFVISRNL